MESGWIAKAWLKNGTSGEIVIWRVIETGPLPSLSGPTVYVLVKLPTVDVSPSHPEIVTEAAVIDVSFASLASKPGSPDQVSPFVSVRFPHG